MIYRQCHRQCHRQCLLVAVTWLAAFHIAYAQAPSADEGATPSEPPASSEPADPLPPADDETVPAPAEDRSVPVGEEGPVAADEAAAPDASPGGDDEPLFSEDELLAPEGSGAPGSAGDPLGVTVEATALDQSVRVGPSVHALTAENLERFSYDDPHAMVLQVPGVYARQEDGFGLRPNIGMRGVSPERSRKITLMEDGVLFAPAPYAAPSAYFFPLLTRMTGMNAYLGPATLPFGPSTVAGAIDWTSRPIPETSVVGADLSLGTYLTGRAHVYGGASNRWGGFLVEGVYLRSDGFQELDFSDRATDTGFDRAEFVAKGEIRGATGADLYHRLELKAGLSLEESNATYLGLSDQDFRANPNRRYGTSQLDRMNWWRTQLSLRHQMDIGDAAEVTTVLYRNDFDRSWFKVNGVEVRGQPINLRSVLLGPDASEDNRLAYRVLTGQAAEQTAPLLLGENARVYASQGAQSDATVDAQTGEVSHRGRFGVRFHYDEVSRFHTEGEYLVPERAVVLNEGSERVTKSERAQAIALSAYAAWRVTWGPWHVTPAVRTELIWMDMVDRLGNAEGSTFQGGFMPGISTGVEVIPGLSLLGGVYRGFSPAAPTVSGSASSETSVNWEAGVRFREAETHLQAMAFYNDYQNLTVVCSVASSCTDAAVGTQTNAGGVNVFGVEAVAAHTVAVDEVRFPMRATYTFVQSAIRDAASTENPLLGRVTPGDRVPYVPEHQLSVQAGVEMAFWGVNVAGTFVGEMWEQAGQGTPETAVSDLDGDGVETLTEAFALLDATAYVRLFEGMRVYVRGENLTLTRAITSRRPFGARPNRPFMLMAGLRASLE